MPSTIQDQTERLVRFSRRQLWLVLAFLLVLGATSLLDFFVTVHIPGMVSVALIIALCLWNPLSTKDIDFSSRSPAMKALRNDELRQAAQAKAFRNGFFVLLAYPPLCAFALIGLGVREPLAFVVASSAWLGAVVFLASLLWHDR
jgi:hypothetical protein